MYARKGLKAHQREGRMVDKMKEGRKGKVVEGNENPKWRSAKGGRGLPGENSVKQRHQQGRENTRRGKGGLQEEVVWFFVVAF